MNHFELFDLPISHRVDAQQLLEKYRALQQQYHPDQFINHSALEQRRAAQQSSLINEAYGVLKKPLRRYQYLLILRDLSFDPQHDIQLDSDFLMSQMALREDLESIRKLPVDEQTTALSQTLSQIDEQRKQIEAKLIGIFETLEHNPAADAEQTDELETSAKAQLQKMQFFEKLQHEIELIEESHFD